MQISVVIPCRNAAPYLAQALGSVLDQRRPAHEIIVVDDGSEDGSLALARRFEERRPDRVRVVAERSGHASRTRNLGALTATGDTILFLDADDVLGPDALEALGDRLRLDASGIAVCPWYRLQLEDGRWVPGPPTCVPRRPGQDPLSAWLAGWYHPPCSVLWSRAAFERAGRWDEMAAVNQDGDLMMRALAMNTPLLETGQGASYYRRHPAGTPTLSGTRVTAAGLSSRIRTIRKTACLLEQSGRLDVYRRALGAALGAVARDARPHHPVLAGRATALAREVGPTRRQRVAGWMRDRVRPAKARTREGVAPSPVEIRYGLQRADEILHAGTGESRAGGGSYTSGVSRPSVTVVIPTYNRAHLLSRTIDSVLRQTFEDYELLIVDDGSSDDTASVVSRCTDPRVRLLRQPENAGVAAARNRGMREARGELIAFLDSDDEWFPEKLSRQVARFRELPDSVGLVYSGVERIAVDGTRTVDYPEARGDVYPELLWRNVIHGGGSNAMIRRVVVAAAGFFHERLPAIEDHEYWLRIARFFTVDYIREPLIRYHHPDEGERRSLALQANLDARWWFYRTYGLEMRRAGVAHLFLVKTARRALAAPEPDPRAARRLAWRALLEKPVSRRVLTIALRAALPRAASARQAVRRRRAALE